MAISTAMCTSFKKELLEAKHNFLASGGNSFKLALYTSSATLSAATTAYSATNETSGTGYSAGGAALTNINPTSSGTTGFTDFDDLTFSSSTITANGALIYNDTASGDPAVCSLAFGGDKTSTSGDFTIQFPTADASNAIILLKHENLKLAENHGNRLQCLMPLQHLMDINTGGYVPKSEDMMIERICLSVFVKDLNL
jgi:hypothetical protein